MSFERTVDFNQKNLAASKVAYRTLAFTSTGISDVAGTKGRINGTLTMRGVSREVALDAEFLGKIVREVEAVPAK